MLSRQCAAPSPGADWCAGRGQDEARLRAGAQTRGLPRAEAADTGAYLSRYLPIYKQYIYNVSIYSGVQAGAGQVHPPRPRPDQAETHPGQEAGMMTASLVSSKSLA